MSTMKRLQIEVAEVNPSQLPFAHRTFCLPDNIT